VDFFEWFAERSGDDKNKRFLNDEQQDAVKATKGAVLVVAGAGTGKTTMITAKTAYLLKEERLSPGRIIMLTFSRDAAAHMKDEVVRILPEARDVYANTFHSFCYDFLKDHSHRTGVTDEFKVLDEANAEFLMYKELDVPASKVSNFIASIQRAKDLDVGREDYERYIAKVEAELKSYVLDPGRLESEVSKAKARIGTMHMEPQTKALSEEKKGISAFLEAYEKHEKYTSFINAWSGYERLKNEKKMLDYADMIKMVIDYCRTWGDDELAGLYDYVIVDEFQDTNRQQYKLLQILASKCKNITAVGDVNQAIYAFRGAYPENLDEFMKDFHAEVKNLTENYRSTNAILRTAHRLIVNNYEDPEETKLLKSAAGTEGEKVRLIRALNPKEQARRLIEEIGRLAKSGVEYNHIAVLFRSHSSADQLQAAFESHGLPFQLISNNGFMKRPEIRTALAYMYVIENLEDPRFGTDQMWWRLLHYKYGISMKDSDILGKAARHGSIQKVLIGELPAGLSEDAVIKINALLAKIELLRQSKNKSLSNLLLDVYEASGLSREFSYEATRNNRIAMLNMKFLHDMTQDFEEFYGTDLKGFIEYMRMLDELSEELQSPMLKEAEGVVLRTCHGAKGLEYDHVFIVDLASNKFPITSGGRQPLLPDEMNDRLKDIFEQAWESDKKRDDALSARKREFKINEERRLAYVAFTRAKKSLTLCYAQTYGESERSPSQFIAESCYTEGGVHNDIEYIEDGEEKAGDMAIDSEIERKRNEVKKLLISTLDSEPALALYNLFLYTDLSGHKVIADLPEAKRAEKESLAILSNIRDGIPRGMKFNPEDIKFSHSSLKVYRECPKKFELASLLRMPSRRNDDEEEGQGALGFGTFVHEVLELAVKNKVQSRQAIDDIANEALKDPGYKAVREQMGRAKVIFDVFWTRNKGRIKNAVMTEQPFSFTLDKYRFGGKIDRVDRLNGDGEVEIIDYKTGGEPSKEDRESQLLMYKLAFEHDPALKATGLKPKNLTLELLEQEKPRVFEIGEDGLMVCVNGRCKEANVKDVEDAILQIARNIERDYEKGFEPIEECGSKVAGSRCEYWMYCPRWG
jgi:DNA helicase-2/ATP-dependent DNA helicase PcrA